MSPLLLSLSLFSLNNGKFNSAPWNYFCSGCCWACASHDSTATRPNIRNKRESEREEWNNGNRECTNAPHPHLPIVLSSPLTFSSPLSYFICVLCLIVCVVMKRTSVWWLCLLRGCLLYSRMRWERDKSGQASKNKDKNTKRKNSFHTRQTNKTTKTTSYSRNNQTTTNSTNQHTHKKQNKHIWFNSGWLVDDPLSLSSSPPCYFFPLPLHTSLCCLAPLCVCSSPVGIHTSHKQRQAQTTNNNKQQQTKERKEEREEKKGGEWRRGGESRLHLSFLFPQQWVHLCFSVLFRLESDNTE